MAAIHVFLDESYFDKPEPLWMVAAAAVPNAARGEKRFVKLYESLRGQSPQFDDEGRYKQFARRGFHYTENNDAIKAAWVQTASTVGYRAHLALSRNPWDLPSPVLWAAMYARLVGSVMRRYRGDMQTYIFEEHESMNRVFSGIVERAAMSAGLQPDQYTIYIGDKADPLLSIPDYLMGGVAAATKEGSAEYEKRPARALALSLAHAMDFDKPAHRRHGRVVL